MNKTTEDEPEKEELSVRARRYRMAQTICMPLINICTGLNVAILSPTIIDMKNLFHTDYANYSKALMFKSLGILVGGFIGGLFTDRYRSKVSAFIAINMLLSGIATGLMPLFPNLFLLGGLCIIQGLTKGCSTTCLSTYILAVWREKAPLPLHVLHTAATLGSMIGPLMSQPFISPTTQNSTYCNMTTMSTSVAWTSVSTFSSFTSDQTTSTSLSTGNASSLPLWLMFKTSNVTFSTTSTKSILSVLPETNNAAKSTLAPEASKLVYVPYVISGALALFVSLIFMIFACIPIPNGLLPKQHEYKTLKKIFSPGSCADGNVPFAIFFLITIFLAFLLHVSRVHALNVFLYPIAVETCSLQFTRTTATVLTTLYFACATLGRIVLGAFSHCIPIKILLFLELVIQLGAYNGLYFLGLKSQPMLWIWACAAAFFGSPIYPTTLSWADRYIEVTGLVVAIIDTGISVGIFLSTLISGAIYEEYHAPALLFFCLVCAAALVAMLALMQIVARIRGDRYKRKETKENTDKDDDTARIVN